ncbi:putative O-methyltransferase [Hypomontagnella monticulosa]|nr:putative O-methyltransferase [Hypomontagnella monticulosa]
MASTVEAILAQLQAAGSAYAEKKPGAREQLLNLSHALISSVELPSEAIQRMGWAEPARAAHCRIAVELKLFELIQESGEQGINAKDLSTKVGADEVLIARTLKHLAAMNIVAESGTDKYVATRLSAAFTEPRYRDGIIYTYDVAGPSFRNLPGYLKDINYALPTQLDDGPFQAAHKTKLPFFGWLDQNSHYLQAFNNYMAAYRAGKPSWVDPGFYPISQRLVEGFDPSSAGNDILLVDVGGGMGHDLRELKEKHPSLPGRLILQDRPNVVSAVSGENVFEATAHDFFTPQPATTKGARAYYLHSVLHDWDDDNCVRILEQLRPSLKVGYSRLLLNEIIVPDRNPTWPVTSMDQLVFVLGAMRERTGADWENILKRAGYRIVKVYSYEMGSESLIEAEVAEPN